MTPIEIGALTIGAFLIGLSKTAVPGLTIAVVPILALAFGARPSVAIMLPLLLIGDLFALGFYARRARWDRLLPLVPAIVPGLVLGGLVLAFVGDRVAGLLIGGLTLAMAILMVLRADKRLAGNGQEDGHGPAGSPLWKYTMGTLAGFSTSAANAAGPVMSIYLLSVKLKKEEFLGTAAWFFFAVNVAKIPVYAALGLFTGTGIVYCLGASVIVTAGALIGYRALQHFSQRFFHNVVLALAFGGAAVLLIRSLG